MPDWSKPIILALLLMALWFGLRSRLAARRTRSLEQQQVTLRRDLDVMQAAVVPEVPAEIGGLTVSAAYRAAEGPAAGGDFYDVFIPEPGKVAVMLGDVVGHGHEALTDAALTRYTLRAYMQAGLEPRATLALASQVLTDPAKDRYVTVAIGLFAPETGELTYATAGHPTPIILGSHEPPTICSCPAISCGLPTGRRQTRLTLSPGAQLCFFSDGLTEARSHDGLLGRERVREIMLALGPRPQAADLLASIRAEADSCPDDMAACIVAPQPAPAIVARHVEELEADTQALLGGHVDHFLEECGVPAAAIPKLHARASAMAGTHGTALLRVELRTAGATVRVSRPRSAVVPAAIVPPPAIGADRIGPATAGR